MRSLITYSSAVAASRIAALRTRRESGAETTEWIFIVVGALVIGGIIIAAVTAFVEGQVSQLPGAQ
ncbi:hypothetical protein GCM10011490_18040 [Pseudoclavibacter endophyticus]|uniref:hypothetical protein n=1 Tax=Pseudoclavibacter endophyticus TaxID=1778590 RepID=UPI00166BC06C|nr:hypothetical protein [Pseudoclavibacter endophyticus]GGA67843.1 hypothetical protein GCM10011490_18040 [Pseudoclavibacter endophyticus]